MRSRLTPRQRLTLRGLLVLTWLVLALVIVGPVLAQDGGTPASSDNGPNDLQGVAAELAPLLVGAALIERLIEALFGWAEQALTDVSDRLLWLARWINGSAVDTAHEVWDTIRRLQEVRAKIISDTLKKAGDPALTDPSTWPLAEVEKQMLEIETQIKKARGTLKTVMDSEHYHNHRKNIAMGVSIVCGLALAFLIRIQVFEPLGISLDSGLFEYGDMFLAGILMGLGTDYVHQFINIFTKGQRFLGARAEQESMQVDITAIRSQIASELQKEFNAKVEELEAKFGDQVNLPGPDEGSG